MKRYDTEVFSKLTPELSNLLKNNLSKKANTIHSSLKTSNLLSGNSEIIPGGMVTVELRNGLGNRIFQLLAAIGYGEKHKKEAVICRAFNNDGPKDHERDLIVPLRKIFPSIKILDFISPFNIVGERQYFKYNELDYFNDNVVLKGYFQAEDYLPSNSLIPNIRTAHYDNTYFIHIRAGDYLLFQNEWGIDVVDYLTKCFSIIKSKIKYLVFSDNPEYANKIMKHCKVNYSISNKTDAYETLIEMANCSGGICANSSFSWLGGLFQKERRGKIFMPSLWNKIRDCSGVYPKWATVINAIPTIYHVSAPLPPSKPTIEDFINPKIKLKKPLQNSQSQNEETIISHLTESNTDITISAVDNKPLPVEEKDIILAGGLVSVQLGGCGFGNKLFKILAGLSYAEKYNKEFVICRNLNGTVGQFHERNMDTEICKIFPNIRFVDSIDKYLTVSEPTIFSPLPYYKDNVILSGFFQIEKFINPSVIPNIRTAYYENTYFVHIRAGDYLLNVAYLSSVIHEYYRICFSIIGNAKYIVFSNDNDYATNFMKQFNVEYTLSELTDPYKTLIEMANCSGGICANSSFSWLGGLFQGEKRGNIFMPYQWVKNNNNTQIYPSWARIIDMNSNVDSLFDIVIPVGPNDISIIKDQIKYTKRNVIGYRNIYLIYKDTSLEIDGCITISENIYPFSMKTVQEFHGKLGRNGWYLQQLLKLYAGNVIPDILDKFLVIDTDTFFLKPTKFIDNGKLLYAHGTENHKAYFDHMSRLDSSLIKMDMFKSGICHHMIFETKYLNELFNLIESKHNDTFYNIFLKQVSTLDYTQSGASEYEMYFNYMLKEHPSEIVVRNLKWQNVSKLTNTDINDYESVHWYIRK